MIYNIKMVSAIGINRSSILYFVCIITYTCNTCEYTYNICKHTYNICKYTYNVQICISYICKYTYISCIPPT